MHMGRLWGNLGPAWRGEKPLATSERPDPDELLTLTQAAALVGLDASTLRQQVHHGKLAAEHLGPLWIVTRRALHEYLRQRGPGGRPVPLPATYQTPKGMQPIGEE